MNDDPEPNETILPPLKDDDVRERLRGLRERMQAANEDEIKAKMREVRQRAAENNPYPHKLRD